MAGRIPEHFIDELLNRVDIVDVIDQRVPLKKAGRDYKACCPFHSEKTPSFTVSQNKQFYYCFGCQAKGSAIRFLMEYDHLSFVEAIEQLASDNGLDVPYEGGRPNPAPTQNHLYELLQAVSQWFQANLRQHPDRDVAVDYLKQRGLSGEVAQRFGIGYAPRGWDNLTQHFASQYPLAELEKAGLVINKDGGGHYDRFRERVMFPILDRRGRTVGFGGRVMQPEDSPKYLNSPETPVFHKGKEIYGLYQARQAGGNPERLVVVEGYMDVVALAQFGVNNAVATLGTALTTDHLHRLWQATDSLIYCFDGDNAGRKAAWRALEETLPFMTGGRRVWFLFLPEGEDPDSIVRSDGAAGFNARLDAATPLSQYAFDHLLEQTDTRTPEGRARLVELAQPLLQRIAAGPFKASMQQRLSELSRLDTQAATAVHGARPVRRSRPGNEPMLSVTAQLVQMLIFQPALAQQVDGLLGTDDPGEALLDELLAHCRATPATHTGALLEHLRDHPMARYLDKLAQMELPVESEAALATRFTEGFARLGQTIARRRFEELKHKIQSNQASADEQQEYALLALKSSYEA